MRPVLAVLTLLFAALAQAAPGRPQPLDEATFRKHLATLASDEFEGRKPATRAEERTVRYIRDHYAALGLKPGNAQEWFQKVPLVEITADPATTLTFQRAGQPAVSLRYGDDMIVWTKRVQPQAAIEASDLVFVGYGIVAPEFGWNDYAGVDMRGKTAVILINDPGFVTGDAKLFNGRAMTYHGRWTYKYEEAARQGAAGALIIHDTAPAAYGWDVVVTSWSGPQLDKESTDGNAGRAAIEGWITGASADKLFALAGKDLAALETAATQRGFKPVPLGARASVGVKNAIRRSGVPAPRTSWASCPARNDRTSTSCTSLTGITWAAPLAVPATRSSTAPSTTPPAWRRCSRWPRSSRAPSRRRSARSCSWR